MSGDLIDGGTITNFNSSGIKDTADSINLVVKNDSIDIETDLNVKGTVRVENLEYVQAQVPKLNVVEAVMVRSQRSTLEGQIGEECDKK